jgi:hypothetical protein
MTKFINSWEWGGEKEGKIEKRTSARERMNDCT